MRIAVLALGLIAALLGGMQRIRAESNPASNNEAHIAAPARVAGLGTEDTPPFAADHRPQRDMRTAEQNDATAEVVGVVLSAPLGGLGLWVLQTDPEQSQTVLAVSTTLFETGVPTTGDWVKVEGVVQVGGLILATSIRLDLFEEHEVIAHLATDVVSSTIASRYGLAPVSGLIDTDNVYLFRTGEQNEEDVLSLLLIDPDVVWAELNYINRVPEGNPYKTWGWGGIDPAGYVNQHALEQIHLDPVRDLYDGCDMVIAVLDTGVDLAHPALVDRLLDGLDVVAGDWEPYDESGGRAWGHGTHVAGIAAQVAPESKILPVRVLDPDGRGNAFLLAYAIEWAAQHDANVINLSLGTPFDSLVLREAVQYVTDQGVIVAASAGNQNSSVPQFPAAYAEVLGVTAVDGESAKASFANYGSDWVDIAAPGVGITSTIIGPDGSGYAAWSGTSMAAPFVSGAAALARQKWLTEPVDTLTQWLRTRTQNINARNPDHADQLGGLLDVAAALEIEETETVSPTQPESTPTSMPTAPASTPSPSPTVSTASPTPPASTPTAPAVSPAQPASTVHVLYLPLAVK